MERIKVLSCKEFTGWDSYFSNTKVIEYLDSIVAKTLKTWEEDPTELNPVDELSTLCFEGDILKNLIGYCTSWSGYLPIFVVPMFGTLDAADDVKIKYVTGLRVAFLDNTTTEKEDQKYKDDDFPYPIKDMKSYISSKVFEVEIYFRPEPKNKFRDYALKHFEYKNYGGDK